MWQRRLIVERVCSTKGFVFVGKYTTKSLQFFVCSYDFKPLHLRILNATETECNYQDLIRGLWKHIYEIIGSIDNYFRNLEIHYSQNFENVKNVEVCVLQTS